MSEKALLKSQEPEAAAIGRFFKPINPWVMEKVGALSVVRTASLAAQQELDDQPPSLLQAWRLHPEEHPAIDRLVSIQNSYIDDAGLIAREGHRVAQKLLGRVHLIEIVGGNPYWKERIGNVACLCMTDEENIAIFLGIGSDGRRGSRSATPEDYGQLLSDVNSEAVNHDAV